MRELTPAQVLTILATRLQKRAEQLERVNLPDNAPLIYELNRFATMAYKARDYVEQLQKPRQLHR